MIMYFCVGFVLSCVFSANSQTPQRGAEFYNGAFINQDPNPIYFEGNQRSFETITPNTPKNYRPGFEVHRNVEPVTAKVPHQDNYSFQTSIETSKQNKESSHKNIKTQANRNRNIGNGLSSIPKDKEAVITGNTFNASDTVTNFGVNLFKQAGKLKSGNTVISPYSITMLLALLQQGANQTTLQQITNALQLPSEASADLYRKITSDVEKRSSQNILRVANNIYVAESFNINSAFKRIATDSFKSEVTTMSFIRPELSAQNINKWVALKTEDKIQKLLSPDSLSENTQMVLVNAVYFKGLWQIPFRPEATKTRPFEIRRGVTKPADFMRTRRYFRTGLDPYTGAKVIILPFEHDQYSLMVILPSTLLDVDTELSSLDVSRLTSYHNFTAQDVELELPKFTVKADTDLMPVFMKMGISNIFSQQSELYGLGTYRTSSPQVSSAIHSAVLSIDEKGGTAAAATAFAVVALSYDDAAVKYIANRPFIAVLWDNASSLPLFMAKVEDPVF